MTKIHRDFWKDLLEIDSDKAERSRLWNGYVGWKLSSKRIQPPPPGWPVLSPRDKRHIDNIAERHRGHPDYRSVHYMDFTGSTFQTEADFSGLTLVACNFKHVVFKAGARGDRDTRFVENCSFDSAHFQGAVFLNHARCDGHVSFRSTQFDEYVTFLGATFSGGASFASCVFKDNAEFSESRFGAAYWSEGQSTSPLADFRHAHFGQHASFLGVLFGNDDPSYALAEKMERVADFSDAQFRAETVFRNASFVGPPAFFNASLHEDTDFGSVNWEAGENRDADVDYAVRAWERLELIMSRLEKPLDRHRFFRLKMRAQRRHSQPLVRMLSWVFDKTTDYGWGVGRACLFWAGHWLGLGGIIYMDAHRMTDTVPHWELALAAWSVSFANAHALLLLTARNGYLSGYRELIDRKQ